MQSSRPALHCSWAEHIRVDCGLAVLLLLQLVFYSLTAVTVAASATSPATSREDTSETPTSSSSSQPPAPQTAAAGFPLDAVYADPWVRQHVVLTYAPETTRDGLGAQAFRLLGIYALSKALGLQYLHTQPECVGHIGGLPHYQGKDCATRLTAADSRKLQRVQRLLALPSSPGVSEAAVRSWHVERLDNSVLTWELLRSATAAALQQQRPTLIKLARVQALLCQHPDVFLAVPQLQPAAGAGVVAGDEMTAAAGASGAASTTAAGDQQDGKVLPSTPQHQPPTTRPWLLGSSSVRVAVHMRRGDITQNLHHLNRVLPVDYYKQVLQQLQQVLEPLSRDVLIELYTERPTSADRRRELAALRRAFPAILTLLVDTDDIWNWQQMASADILVLSLSTYAVVPSLLNPNALVIAPNPVGLDGKPKSFLHMRHWHHTVDHKGALPPEVLQQLQLRFGGLPNDNSNTATQPATTGTLAADGDPSSDDQMVQPT